ncbi:MAG: IS21 family transposase [Proteobacteria bacterium]|nr:IS21 family transposase [Pseudomonadota bacterium]
MLDKEMQAAILALRGKGCGIRKIAKELDVSRNSVRSVIHSGLVQSGCGRGSQLDAYLEDIRRLYAVCEDKRKGRANLVRVREKLKDLLEQRGEKLEASYSALTWFCRGHGLGVVEKDPTRHIRTAPGEEMQHDTSPYVIKLGGKKVKRQCASLVFGYSRMSYVQFYPDFDRFQCKIFLTDAFKYLEGTCRRCVIDNTSVILACGAGQMAQVAPEVEAFEKRFGFRFMAHEILDCNRKGKVERPFDYVEGNFLVGRIFKDDLDLNSQALAWLEAANRRRLREFKASPIELFAAERPQIVPLPLFIPEVYRIWQRGVDSYGCVSLHGLKYPAPAAYIGKELVVRETKDRVIFLDGRDEVANLPKKTEGSPAPPQAPFAPRRQKSAQLAEEGKLKVLGGGMEAYLQALKTERGPRYIWSLKKLYRLACQYKAEDLLAAVDKAAGHRLFDINRIETILLQDLAGRDYFLPLESQPEDYEAWPQYQQGAATPEPDLKNYAPEEERTDDK